MGKQADAVKANAEKLVAQAAVALVLEMVANLTEATPVDTGWARANWIPTIGTPRSSPTEQPSKGAHADRGEQEQAAATVLRFTLADAVLYVSNAVPYIGSLNYGHSTQAPSGFVERAVALALETMAARYQGVGIDLTAAAFRQEIGAQGAENLAAAYLPEGL